MTRTIIATLLMTISCFALSCGPTEIPWAVCEKLQNNPQPIDSTITSTDDLVIYLDTSASMAGYISTSGGKGAFAVAPDGQTVFSKTLLELRNVVTTLSPQPSVFLRKVDTTISVASNSDLELSQAALNRSLYVGKETNLAGAIKEFSLPIDKTSENNPPAKFHILISDGVQSSSKQDADTSCVQGSDPFCIKKQFLDLLNNGWSGSIIGIRSEFQGIVYSEINKAKLNYSSGREVAKFRPFYLYIFSPDKAALTKLTATLKQRLSQLNPKPDSLHEFPLSSGYSNGIPEIVVDNPAKNLVDAKIERTKENANPRISVRTSTKTANEGAKEFTLKIKIPWTGEAAYAGTPDELLSLLRWEIVETKPENQNDNGKRFPSFKLVKQEIKGEVVYLTFETGWRKEPGELSQRMFRLIGKVDESKIVPPWVKNWSTDVDTSIDNANRTLNLESSLGNLWKNNAMQSAAIGDGCVKVVDK